MSDPDPKGLSDRRTFPHWQRITIRSTDEDPLGHVNNCVYAEWLEVARVLLIQRYLDIAPKGMTTVLASMTIDFLNETGFPGEVEVGARLTAVGNRSLRSSYGIFRGDLCLATSLCVNVFFDMEHRTSTAPTDAMRQAMERDLVV